MTSANPRRRDRSPPVQRGHPPPPAPHPRRPSRRHRHVVRRVGAERRGDRRARRLRRLDAASDSSRSAASGIWSAHVAGRARRAVVPLRRHRATTASGWRSPIPSAAATNEPPSTASVIADLDHDWGDDEWMAARGAARCAPTRRSRSTRCTSGRGAATPTPGRRFPRYDEIADPLADHVLAHGFTHVELLPIMEHPFYGSWGYQTTGYFAPTARYGTPQDLMAMVDRLHQRGRRRDPRLGAVALPDGRPRPRPLRRHPPLRARRPAPGLPPRLDVGDLQLRPPRGALVPHLERPVLARPLPRRRAARRRRGLDAVPRLLPRRRRVDPQPPRRPGEPRRDRLPAPAQRRHRTRSSPTSPRSPRSRRRGRWSPGRRPTAGSASRTSGTWAGCTTRCSTSGAIRCTGASTTTRSRSAACTPSPSTTCCRCRTTRSSTARARCSARCPATTGSASPTCGCCSG